MSFHVLLRLTASAAILLGAARAYATPVGTAFTYQGELRSDGVPVNDTCDVRFTLLDQDGQVGAPQTSSGLAVTSGVFTTAVDFGAAAFAGADRQLRLAVRCGGAADFTTLEPPQPVNAAPYALGLRPGATMQEAVPGAPVLTIANATNVGLRATGAVKAGVLGITTDAVGSGVEGNATGGNAAGVFGTNTTGPGVWGRGTDGGVGVLGQSTKNGIVGVGGFGSGAALDGSGVIGQGAQFGSGVVGTGLVGVMGTANGASEVSQGIRGDDGANGGSPTAYAAVFNGRVAVAGNLSKFSGSFRIDHPLDPANKFLSHSFVESPDMKNVYDGIVTLDGTGAAEVVLPDYFEALNADFRYQLTCIGGYAPVYIAREVAEHRFTVAGGTPGLKVSWQVTGTRRDAYAEQHRVVVEEDKGPSRGKYLYPAGFGMPPETGLFATSAAGDGTIR